MSLTHEHLHSSTKIINYSLKNKIRENIYLLALEIKNNY